MRGRQGRWQGRETGGARSRLTRRGVQQRGAVDRAVVVVFEGGVGDSSGWWVRRRRYVGARCLVRVIASSRRLSSLSAVG